MDNPNHEPLAPGTRLRVTEQIAARDHAWTATVEGTVVSYAQRPTGSWFAHARDDRLWLDRLVMRKDDGELTTLNLDQFARIEVLSSPQAPAATQAAKSNPPQ